MSEGADVLILPGWQNSGPGHWQTRWEAVHGYRRVEQADWDHPLRGDWMARLEEVLLQQTQPVLLVAHSLGCQLVAAWAAHSRNCRQVRGALLVAPPDTERPDMPPQLSSWRRIERQQLPFSALLVHSLDDPFCSVERARGMAADWSARVQEAGAIGHINAESGLGDWPAGHELLKSLG
jgi:uncharacterized protein